jgi:hypothetical protein
MAWFVVAGTGFDWHWWLGHWLVRCGCDVAKGLFRIVKNGFKKGFFEAQNCVLSPFLLGFDVMARLKGAFLLCFLGNTSKKSIVRWHASAK